MTNTNIIPLDTSNIYTQPVEAAWLQQNDLTLNVLRLDNVHEVVSGNKWFKLKYYLEDAKTNNKHTIATFGGAWSNHIVATAYAAKQASLKSVGIIRGEEPATYSATLHMVQAYGMELVFVSREAYKNKDLLIEQYANTNWYWIDEGGYGALGAKGIEDMFKANDLSSYRYIVTAVGTGTTLAGLVASGNSHQQYVGISSMKSNLSLENQVNLLLPGHLQNHFTILHDYHFGGYGKHPPELIDFLNNIYSAHHLPLDIVYTGRTFYAIHHLAQTGFFKRGSNILMIHTGGLQGNKSLPPKVLAF